MTKSLLERHFTAPGTTLDDVFRSVDWTLRNTSVKDDKGNVLFAQTGLEFPITWSDQAVRIVAKTYFRGALGTPEREYSLKQLLGRVVRQYAQWVAAGGYLPTAEAVETFAAELGYILLDQRACFNTPVWLNVGLPPEWSSGRKPQVAACFILSVEDYLEGPQGILDWYATEGIIFRGGSGSGVSGVKIRSKFETISGGGKPSGFVSFMRPADAVAASIKSGGKTRRAAKLTCLPVDHGDIEEYIWCKAKAERLARKITEARILSAEWNAEDNVYQYVGFQNANNSVRATDAFMQAVAEDTDWWTLTRKGDKLHQFKARDLYHQICEAAHECGDPGLQFDDVINRWNPVLDTARIHATNPCGEYNFLDDTACNLASICLTKFRENGRFQIEDLKHTIRVMILAQEASVGNAGYPTPLIEENSHKYRPLGLGFADLGSLVMQLGLPYDSEVAREVAGAISSLLCGEAYRMSARIAEVVGPFPAYEKNEGSFRRVMAQHSNAAVKLQHDASHPFATPIAEAGLEAWREAIHLGTLHGYRNAQVTVIAPTGTIGFMMDCTTTGIEPELSLKKYKKLAGGGTIVIPNRIVHCVLRNLGYSDEVVATSVAYVQEKGYITGAPGIEECHYPIFDTSLDPGNGRFIAPLGHIKMMAAVQPFVSGAISKTVNLPSYATVDDFKDIYQQAWKLGIKAVALYRDNCKGSQPLSVQKTEVPSEPVVVLSKPVQRKMPDTRTAEIHKFRVAGVEVFLHMGMYDDGTLGEVFITISKEGSFISGLFDLLGNSMSVGLQYGVPLQKFIEMYEHTNFQPQGFTGYQGEEPELKQVSSIPDYIAKYLRLRFLHPAQGPATPAEQRIAVTLSAAPPTPTGVTCADAPPCGFCGSLMVRNGSCYKCLNCGQTSGCS